MRSSFKMRFIGTLFVLIASCASGSAVSEIEVAFRTSFLVPYITKYVPPNKLSVKYSSEIVNLGNKIPAYSASVPPYITYDANPECYYAIIMIDADFSYVGAPINAQYLHAMVLNIPGNDLVKANYVTPYTPVNPYVGSGYHRYIFYLFLQSEKIDTQCEEIQNLPFNLSNFDMEVFAAAYGLGNAIAANFFLAQLNVCDDDDDIPQICVL